ncbi:MAG: hypothetical protein ACK4RG_05460 [Fimbriimonadales bacterium]
MRKKQRGRRRGRRRYGVVCAAWRQRLADDTERRRYEGGWG